MKAEEMLESFPEHLEAVKVDAITLEGYKGIVFSGMGGSGIVGDILKTLLERENIDIPTLSVKGYELPPFVKDGWMVFCVSYSGNTEETLSVAEIALSRGIKPICISSGGRLKELAKTNGLMHVELPQGYPPRYALGFMLSALFSLLGISSKNKLKEKQEEVKEKAKRLAEDLEGYLPVIYATPLLEAVATRWKTQINENAKTLCYTAILPELHHNEVVGLENPTTRDTCHFVILYDPDDHERVIKRVNITQELLKDLGISPPTFTGEGERFLDRLLYLIHLGDWTSFYLAELYGYDPIPVKVIESIKQKLSS